MDISALGERLVRISLTGRLDTQGVDRVEKAFVAAVVPGGNNALVDLSHVSFVASMGIRMLVSAARALKNHEARLVLFGVQPNVADVFEAVSLQKIIAICATEADALAAVAARQT